MRADTRTRNRGEHRRSPYPECLLTNPGLSSPRTLRFRPLQRPEFGRILEPASAAWRGRLDYTQLPLASSANRRATGRPPGVASASTCFPDADPTMPPRDRPLHFQVRADVPNKKPKMSAKPPDKRFAYLDCAPALPRAQGRSPRFWLAPILKFPLIDQREPEHFSVSVCESSCVIGALGNLRGPPRHRLLPESILHFRLGLIKK